MTQRRLLSGSSGTFWGLVRESEWTRMLITDASVVRATDRQSTPNTVVSAYSDDGFKNTVTVEDVDARLNAGGLNLATYFGFPITKPDGSPVDLGADCFTINFALEITDHPGATDDNNVIIGLGINDGTSSMENGRFGGFISFDNSGGPRIGCFSGGGGAAEGGFTTTQLVMRTITSTTPTGSEANPFVSIMTDGYDVNGDFQRNKLVQGATQYGNAYGSRPVGTGSYAFITIGRKGTAGSGAKNFSFRAFYKVSLHTINDTAAQIPRP